MLDLYNDFAGRYDLPYSRTADRPTENFFRQLFTRYKVNRVLDCACGTGRHLLIFNELGCEVCGSDVSVAMLEQAEKNLALARARIPLLQTDFRHLPEHFKERFDAVICLAAIGYMPDEGQFLKAFESMAGVLRNNGILVLTAIPTDRQWSEKPKYALVADTPTCTRVFAMHYFKNSVRYTILDILRGPDGSQLQTWSAKLSILLRDDQERLLKAAGFRSVDFFGGYDFSPYDKLSSDQMITVAYK